MKFFQKVCLLAVAFAVTAGLQAQGFVVVQQETRSGKTNTNQVAMDKTHIKSESHASGESMAFVFDGAAQTARIMNLDKKSYVELNRAVMQQQQQQIAQLQDQLKNLPPEQRAIMEQAMRGRGGLPGGASQPAAKIEYKQTGSDKVGQWSCTRYEGYRGPQKVMEVCTVDPKELGVTLADFEVARQLAEFLRGMMPQVADQIVVAGTVAEQGFSGVPVRRTTYTNGNVDTVTETKEVRHETIPASAFEIPAGFRRENIGGR